jgi:5-hydroxyisourate hydrolase
MSAITTHVLDTARGVPAVDVAVRLERVDAAGNIEMASACTDANGRVSELGPELIEPGTYRLVFDTAAYASGTFFPEVAVTFTVTDEGEHYHVPLLLSPFGYSTYRGS